MKYCRINLNKTNYTIEDFKYIHDSKLWPKLFEIYQSYCKYKKFESVMPLFEQQFYDPMNEVIGYYHLDELVAFSIIKIYNNENAEALQFAWNYVNPELQLGIKSLKNECALYKHRGFKYLYLGQAAEYKSQIDGYEILGKL